MPISPRIARVIRRACLVAIVLAVAGAGVVAIRGREPDTGADGADRAALETEPARQAAHSSAAPRPETVRQGPEVRTGDDGAARPDSSPTPVTRPETIPEGLQVLVADERDPRALERQLDVLDELSRPQGAEELHTLRWLIRQKDRSPVLRNELANRLDEWNPEWYLSDLAAMAADPAQPLVWRAYAIQHLRQLYDRHRCEGAVAALRAAAAGPEPKVRGQAVFCLAELAAGNEWRTSRSADYHDFTARLREAQCLGEIGRAESRAVLAACAAESNRRIRSFAASSMARLGDSEGGGR